MPSDGVNAKHLRLVRNGADGPCLARVQVAPRGHAGPMSRAPVTALAAGPPSHAPSPSAKTLQLAGSCFGHGSAPGEDVLLSKVR